jgi:alkylation response protein AidB-like acyl-CoA dehydrogenase
MLFERGGGVSSPGLTQRLARIGQIAAAEPDGGNARLIDDPAFRAKLAQAAVDVAALEAVELRTLSALSGGAAPGPESSMTKTVGTELSQRLTELALEAVGVWGLPFQPYVTSPGGLIPGFEAPEDRQAAGPEHAWPVAAKYFNDRAGSIYAGTNEIQRNIMAKAILGL